MSSGRLSRHRLGRALFRKRGQTQKNDGTWFLIFLSPVSLSLCLFLSFLSLPLTSTRTRTCTYLLFLAFPPDLSFFLFLPFLILFFLSLSLSPCLYLSPISLTHARTHSFLFLAFSQALFFFLQFFDKNVEKDFSGFNCCSNSKIFDSFSEWMTNFN